MWVRYSTISSQSFELFVVKICEINSAMHYIGEKYALHSAWISDSYTHFTMKPNNGMSSIEQFQCLTSWCMVAKLSRFLDIVMCFNLRSTLVELCVEIVRHSTLHYFLIIKRSEVDLFLNEY